MDNIQYPYTLLLLSPPIYIYVCVLSDNEMVYIKTNHLSFNNNISIKIIFYTLDLQFFDELHKNLINFISS